MRAHDGAGVEGGFDGGGRRRARKPQAQAEGPARTGIVLGLDGAEVRDQRRRMVERRGQALIGEAQAKDVGRVELAIGRGRTLRLDVATFCPQCPSGRRLTHAPKRG